MKTDLSVFIIARDEADRIGRTIASVKGLSADIVVVDSGSSDATVEVARALGARVVHKDWAGYGPQKRFGERQCAFDWVLNLDADEVVSPALREEIARLLVAGSRADAYYLRIVDVCPGDDVPRVGAHHHDYVRLYDRRRCGFSESAVHDTVHLAGPVATARLKGHVHHFSVRSFARQLEKYNGYSDQLVADLLAHERRIPRARLFVEFPASFVKAYVLRRYFLRGTVGYNLAMNYAFFRFMRLAKYFEAKGKRKAGR
ncbi:MAG: glycosyltransferase family 2 protein [Xanthomonadales bacterium]|uniref:glycosyltransferase family 2 protein n=1 Tax=Dokdonella sp. TaxID=2291710 RepID=UPI00131292C5|nr:glycosyltransferase family 2 protein [Dokdonella sp.]MBC6941222.1 glycosyltransferase family 2 protein [Xanthomonadales bacterium]MDL1868226.1 glycosyltransferase family 2 protein [Gammaproteobacteria bacterium PRO6]KAB2899604.1 MAG: glycosyltransferase family 2 protein [Dokdonella sp.]MBX3700403.1 glycosyltransferase family 2 protein [Dokdonella sp.]MCW5579396.1 glycosyltransferase family 2 protein [Dokdonella sp.]